MKENKDPLYRYCLHHTHGEHSKAWKLEKMLSFCIMVICTDVLVIFNAFLSTWSLALWIPFMVLPNIRLFKLISRGWFVCDQCRRLKDERHRSADDFGPKDICSRCGPEVGSIQRSIEGVQKGVERLCEMVGEKVEHARQKEKAPLPPPPPKAKPPEPPPREFKGREFHAPPLDEQRIARTVNPES